MGCQRRTYRERRRAKEQTALRMRRGELAGVRGRYGSRRLHPVLRREGWPVTPNRVDRPALPLGRARCPRHDPPEPGQCRAAARATSTGAEGALAQGCACVSAWRAGSGSAAYRESRPGGVSGRLLKSTARSLGSA